MRYRVLIKFNPTAARVYIHIYEYGDGNDPIRMFVLQADRMPKPEQRAEHTGGQYRSDCSGRATFLYKCIMYGRERAQFSRSSSDCAPCSHRYITQHDALPGHLVTTCLLHGL